MELKQHGAVHGPPQKSTARACLRPPLLAPAVLLLIVAGLLLAGCGGGSAASAGGRDGGAGGTITLYSGQHPQTTAVLVAAFERRTGIKVLVRNGDEDVLANQIVQEGPGSPADVYYGANSLTLQFLSGRALLAQVAAGTLAAVPARFDSPAGQWVGVSARVTGIVYNTRLLTPAELPRSVMELAAPRWAGRLALAPSETDFQPIINSIALTYGKAAALRWLKGVKANASGHTYPDNETITSMVNSGQAQLGITPNYYWHRLVYELGHGAIHSAFTYLAPRDPGYVMSISGAGVLRSSSHQTAAQRLLAFLVSKEGEQIIADSQSYEYPLGSGVVPSPSLTPFGQLHSAPLSISRLGDGQGALTLLQQAQLL